MMVRLLGPADATLYRALRLRALRDHPDAFTSSYADERERPLEAASQRLAAHAFWGAYRHAELWGMVGLEREPRARNRHKATVMGMYVAPEARGQGVARPVAPGGEHDLEIGTLSETRASELNPVDIGQPEIGHQHVEAFHQHRQRLLAGTGCSNRVAKAFEHILGAVADEAIVLDQQYLESD